VFDMIAGEEKRATFHLHHPTYTRALFGSMIGNNRRLWTIAASSGWGHVIRMAPINENVANLLVSGFSKLPTSRRSQTEVMGLKEDEEGRRCKKHPSTGGRIDTYLAGLEERMPAASVPRAFCLVLAGIISGIAAMYLIET